MEFIKSIMENRKLITKMGMSDLKNRFSSTSLGAFWGFLQPIKMLGYSILNPIIVSMMVGKSRQIASALLGG